jgi:peroxiredoxin
MGEFATRGIGVAAISVDPPQVNRGQCEKWGLSFPLLADTNGLALRKYDLLHAGGGPKGIDIAKPAEFLVDSRGIIRWRNVTWNASYRARPGAALRASEELTR